MENFFLDNGTEMWEYINDAHIIVPYDEVERSLINEVNSAINNIATHFPNYSVIKVVFVDECSDQIGTFIAGTSSSEPVFLINLNFVDEYDNGAFIHTTIYHEYGHALFELDRDIFDGAFLNNDEVDEEEYVEDFATSFYDLGEIPNEFKLVYNKLPE